MLANGVKETTTTTGTGTVTLSAVTGYPRFSQVLSVGQFVDYAIQDGNNWEWGVGKVAASNTLERTLITAKFDGGTYSKYPASPLSLSGSATVFCTITAERAGDSMGNVRTGSFQAGVVGSAHLVQTEVFGSTYAISANRVTYIPFVWPPGAQRFIKGFKLHVTAAGTATKMRIGVLKPLRETLTSIELLMQTSDIAVTTTGTKSISLASPIVIAEPRVMLAVIADGTVTLRAAGAVVPDPYAGFTQAGLYYKCELRNAEQDAGWTEITTAMVRRNWIANEADNVKTIQIFMDQA